MPELPWSSKRTPVVCFISLGILNAFIARKLFVTEFTQHMNSNEGSFMAISRFIVENWPHIRWFPRWFLGVPFENTYSPLLQFVDAGFAAVAHVSTALAFHAVCALFYSVGPALFFLFAWRLTKATGASLFGALLYSLYSPSTLFSEIRSDMGSWRFPRRLHTLVNYGEGPHNIALALAPLALLLVYFALTRRSFRWYVACGAGMATLVLLNAFGAIDLAVGSTSLILAFAPELGFGTVLPIAATAIAAYVWISPSLPPSLIQILHVNSLVVGGDFRPTLESRLGGLAILAGLVLAYFCATRMHDAFERFVLFFAFVFTSVVVLAYRFEISVVAQPKRYHLEFELAFCLIAVCVGRRLFAYRVETWRWALVATAAPFFIWQLNTYQHFARGLIHRIDIHTTIEYKKIANWLDTNLRGQRAMVSDAAGVWFNEFSNNPQISSGHDPFSPNWMVEIAVYSIYSGEGAGARDAANALLWLEAFGAQAITVPGPHSREEYKPFRNPHKFDGVVPLLWHDEDDSIYAVPQRTASLAHVIPAASLVNRPPVNGLDIEQISRYVAAIENTQYPVPTLAWRNSGSARISAPLAAGQAVSLQVNYDPGWHARANGREIPVRSDGLGLIAMYPECTGPCDIDLEFGFGFERIACWIASLLVTLGVLGIATKKVYSRR